MEVIFTDFPLYVAYINKKEITPSVEDQFFFDDVNTTVVKADTKKLIKSYQIKRLSGTPYKIIALFRYK
jgi:hypothetical protein